MPAAMRLLPLFAPIRASSPAALQQALACIVLACAAALATPARAQVGVRPAADAAALQAIDEAAGGLHDAVWRTQPASGERLSLLDVVTPGAAPRMLAATGDQSPGRNAAQRLDARTLARRNALAIGGGIAGVATYGFAKWWNDGFNRRADFEREGWFGRGTRYGGIDKVGHAYANYLSVRLLTPLLEAIGNEPAAAQRLAFWSTVGTFAGVEVLDAYSKRFAGSVEDMVANLAGSFAALALLRGPDLDQLIDLRLGYRRSAHNDWDPAGDYEGQVYLLVLKGEGIRGLRDNAVGRYLEFSVGYAARGFDLPTGVAAERQRELQAGISLNLSRVLADVAYGGQRGSTPVQRAADLAFELVQFAPRVRGRIGLD